MDSVAWCVYTKFIHVGGFGGFRSSLECEAGFEKHLADRSQSDRARQEIIANKINSLFQRAIRSRGKVAQRRNKSNVKSALSVEIDCVLCPTSSRFA